MKQNIDTTLLAGALLLAGLALRGTAVAQGYHHPFAVGANEGAVGHVSGFTAWLIERQSAFYRLLAGAVRDIRDNRAAGWELAGLSFAYGAFHAAGPGHGKAVVTSYLIANEATLRRGLTISALAALVQGLVAIALVGIAAIVFHATAARMTEASVALEYASYAAIMGLGLMLAWRKGTVLLAALRPAAAFDPERLFAAAPLAAAGGAGSFAADDGTLHSPGLCDCGHSHIPDPSTLGRGFSWKSAGVTILSAGARPCSGAILVLVFALAQGIFLAGVWAALAMACGVALTTGLLAGFAVFAKSTARRLLGAGGGKRAWLLNLIEFGAALCVILFGAALLAASLSGALFQG